MAYVHHAFLQTSPQKERLEDKNRKSKAEVGSFSNSTIELLVLVPAGEEVFRDEAKYTGSSDPRGLLNLVWTD